MSSEQHPPLQSKPQTDTLWLEQYLFWLFLICIIISIFEFGSWLIYGYLSDVIGIVAPAGIAGAILFARYLVRKQRVQIAVIFINIIFFLIAISAALTTGGLVMQAIFVPLTSLILALPFLSARYMQSIVITTWISTAVVVIASVFVSPIMPMPRWAPLVTGIIGLIVLATLIRLLWLHHSHLLALLNEHEQANAQLQEIRSNLEQQVAVRTSELQAERELYHTLIQNFPRGLVMLYDQDLRYTLAEGLGMSELNYSQQEIVGKTIWEIYPPDICASIEPYYRLALAGEHVQYEAKFGHRVYDVQMVPIRNSDSQVVAGLVVSQNITDRYLAQQALQESEDRYRQLIEFSPDAVFVHQHQRFVYLNPVAVKLLGGTSLDELIGRDVLDFVDPESHAMIKQRINQITYEQQPTPQGTWILRQEKGVRIHVESVGIHILLNGEPSVLALVRDISARKQAEEEQRVLERKLQETQRLESLGVLAGGIAHDFNNLLMGMLGNTSLALVDLPDDSPARDSILRVEHAALRAAELVRQMLAYAGKGRFMIGPINLNQLLEEMMRLLRASIPRTIAVDCFLNDHLLLIEGDAAQLRQVVMNLIVNASEAIGEAVGTITITTSMTDTHSELLMRLLPEQTEQARPYIQLEIIDTGCGMDTQTLSRMFDPFFTTKFTGRGLGLAAVQGIIRSHNGLLEVTSTVAVGSTFGIWLPALSVESDSDQFPLADTTIVDALIGATGGIILIIDDEESVRNIVSRIIQHLGYTPLLAEDGVQGIELFRNHADVIKCVLLDLAMPNLGGVQVFQAIRQIQPDARVLLMSGYSEQEIASSINDLDQQDIIAKPFSLDVLRNRLQHILVPELL